MVLLGSVPRNQSYLYRPVPSGDGSSARAKTVCIPVCLQNSGRLAWYAGRNCIRLVTDSVQQLTTSLSFSPPLHRSMASAVVVAGCLLNVPATCSCVSGTGPLLGQRWDWSAGVSIPWLGEMESLVCNFCLNVAARKIVRADPSLRYTSLLLGRWATNKQQPLRKLYVLPHYDGSCGSVFLSHPVTVYWHRANPITDPSLRHTSMLLGR